MGADEAVLDKPSCNLQEPVLLLDISRLSPTPSAGKSSQRISPRSVTKSSAQLDIPAPTSVQLKSPKLAHLDHIESLPDLATALGRAQSLNQANFLCDQDELT